MNRTMFGRLADLEVRDIQTKRNTIASECFIENYEKLQAKYSRLNRELRMGIEPSKITDLLHDVYESLVRDENLGKGYEEVQDDGGVRTPLNFINGRIAGYAKNRKYRAVDRVTEICADNDTDDFILSEAQTKYALACSYDELELVEAKISLCADFEYILTFQNEVNVDLRYILKNMGNIASQKFDKEIMSGIRNLIKSNIDFADALRSLIKMYSYDPEGYSLAVAQL